MKRRKYQKNLWSRMTAMLLIAGLMLALLCGCSDGKNNTPPQIQSNGKDPAATPEAEVLDTMDKVVAYVEERIQSGAGEFSFTCSEEIYNELLKITYKADGTERKIIHGLLNQTGVHYCKTITAGMKRSITISDIILYPGYGILRSIEAGKENSLPSKLKKTLTEAQAMADACRASDPLETAENIQSAICARVRYAAMISMSDGDTAVGALLNDVADCDGYADTFYLVGSLAGLEVRYQHGIASYYDLNENKLVSSSHMWNLLKLDGTWRVVDVCWADGQNGIDYTWFNIGKDRASRSRTWYEDLSVPLLETTDLSTRPETEYSVTSREELEAAIKEAVEKEQNAFTIIFDAKDYFSANNYGSRGEVFDVLGNYYAGAFSYYWDERSRVMNIILEDYEAEP